MTTHRAKVRRTRTGWSWHCTCGERDYAYPMKETAVAGARLHEKRHEQKDTA